MNILSNAILFIAASTIIATPATAQDTGNNTPHSGTNTVYFEAGGPGVFYSLNYMRGFYVSSNFDFCAGAFVSPYFRKPVEGVDFWITAGLQLQALYKVKAHEIGLGGAITDIRNFWAGEFLESYPVEFAHLSYGYTFRSHLYLGASAILVLFSDGYSVMEPWAALRIGYRFNKQHNN